DCPLRTTLVTPFGAGPEPRADLAVLPEAAPDCAGLLLAALFLAAGGAWAALLPAAPVPAFAALPALPAFPAPSAPSAPLPALAAGFFAALFAAAPFGAAAAAFFAGATRLPRPKRPVPRSGACSIITRASSSVIDFGSRSFGILAFFLPFVTYGP